MDRHTNRQIDKGSRRILEADRETQRDRAGGYYYKIQNRNSWKFIHPTVCPFISWNGDGDVGGKQNDSSEHLTDVSFNRNVMVMVMAMALVMVMVTVAMVMFDSNDDSSHATASAASNGNCY